MLAVLPYYEIPPLKIGPQELHAFGFLVGISIIVGTTLLDRRAEKFGLSRQVTTTFAMWAIVPGFIGAHVFQVLFYNWPGLVEDPWLILRFWDGISSFGGFLGGAAGVLYYLKKNRIPFWPYGDTFAYAFTFAWIFGRMGCTVAFDHPGELTDFALAMPYVGKAVAHGIRHNLGFYELLYTLVMVSVFFLSRNKTRPAGWYLSMQLLMYTPVRFCLDFLRVADVRYLGLTFAQYVAAILFVASIFMLIWRIRVGEPLVPDGKEHVFSDGRRAYEVPPPPPALPQKGRARRAAR
jgi:phosphatidylglycerol:prolipoprotein diacylglycerol transferase